MSLLSPISLINTALGISRAVTRGVSSGIKHLTHPHTKNNIDSVEISDQARILSNSINPDKLANLLGITPDADGKITMEEITKKIQEDIATFQDKLGKIFSKAGIDTNREIQLGLDNNGKIIVLNDHPDASKIEHIFQENLEIANDFRKISAEQDLMPRR